LRRRNTYKYKSKISNKKSKVEREKISFTVPKFAMEELPWVEKYRPNSITDILDQTAVTNLFESSIRSKQSMHLLFHGPPGTGKTSTILAFCRKLYTGRKWEDYVLEINASYERGLQFIQERVKDFCKKAITPFYSEELGLYVNYKFIVLDEADSLSSDSQTSLRRMIEIYSSTTRFCFLCNYVNRINTSIVSRCFLCHFHPVGIDTSVNQMKKICASENVTYSDQILHKIYNFHHGDLRSCISTLQAMFYLYKTIDEESFSDFVLELNLNDFSEKMQNIHTSSSSISSTYPIELQEYAYSLNEKGISPRTLLRGMIDWLLDNGTDHQNYKFAEKVSLLERQSTMVKCSEIMVLQCLMTFYNIYLSKL
jgi:DNA polymerase III delta prime subunit